MADLSLRQTAQRNALAENLLALEAQAQAAIRTLVAAKVGLLAIRAKVVTAGDLAEVDAVVKNLADSVRTDVLG